MPAGLEASIRVYVPDQSMAGHDLLNDVVQLGGFRGMPTSFALCGWLVAFFVFLKGAAPLNVARFWCHSDAACGVWCCAAVFGLHVFRTEKVSFYVPVHSIVPQVNYLS